MGENENFSDSPLLRFLLLLFKSEEEMMKDKMLYLWNM